MEQFDKTSILSPVMLWRDFNALLPLKESKVFEDVIDNVIYSHVYFYGRDTGLGRVRIYGVYARLKNVSKKAPKAGLLIIPDIGAPIDLTLIDLYVKQGYTTLMIDYCGETDKSENYTQYPECVSYANYNRSGRALDYCDKTAKETSWYEWVSVARYGISFLKNLYAFEKIGVLGIKDGANIGWQLCGTDKRIDCFVPLFGAGWRSYKNAYKFSESDKIDVNDERLRYLAAVDAHAYAQYVNCPVFYMTGSNSDKFDLDRAMDTVLRVPQEEAVCALNVSPRYSTVLDPTCKRNVDLFLAKYLFGYRVELPKTPKVTVTCEDKSLTAFVEIDFSDLLRPKRFCVFVAEGGENPAFRDWSEMTMLKSLEENKKTFVKNLYGNSGFVNVFAVVEYKNGFTVSSVVTNKKVPKINTRRRNLIYSSGDRLSDFSIADGSISDIAGVYFEDKEPVEYVEGSNKIFGVRSKYGLINYKLNERLVSLNERTLLSFDVCCSEFARLKVTLIADDGNASEYDYFVAVKGGDVWQHVMIKCCDFKSDKRLSIKDYSKVVALKLLSDSKLIFNNILIV